MCAFISIAQKTQDVKSAEKNAQPCAFSLAIVVLSFLQRNDLHLADGAAVHTVDAEEGFADGQLLALDYRALQAAEFVCACAERTAKEQLPMREGVDFEPLLGLLTGREGCP